MIIIINEESFYFYHATNKARAEKILKSGFEARKNDKHWLGQGVYFYKYIRHAEDWCKKTKYIKGESPVVIKALINVKIENHFDLDDTEIMDEFRIVVEKILSSKKRILKYKTENHLICACFDAIVSQYNYIYLISYTFPKNKVRFYSKFVQIEDINKTFSRGEIWNNEIQYCVTSHGLNNKIIYENNIEKEVPCYV